MQLQKLKCVLLLLLFVSSVQGPVSSEQLGRTLTHEHFSLNFETFYTQPPEQLKPYFENGIYIENVGFIKQYPYCSEYNLKFNDADTHAAVLHDIELYKKFGGGTIVENTTTGLGRNIDLMQLVSQKTGVNVIAGTGYYVSAVQTSSTLSLSVEQMYNAMKQDLTLGCSEQPDVKCGFIGEVGSTWPITDFEKRAIIATAEVQAELGCPVSFHPGRDPDAPFEIIRLFQEAGGQTEKTIMSHLDRTLNQEDQLMEFSSLGTYCQFDLFGIECSLYQFNPKIDMPSDAQRIDHVIKLIAEGKENKILLAHDIHTKHRLIHFGGHGYSHIINNVLPKMLIKGITQSMIDKITIENPKCWLAYTK